MSKGLWFETFSTLAVRDNKMSNVRWIFYYVLNFLIWWVRMKKYICKPIPFTIDFMSSIRCELNLILNYECEMTFWFFLYNSMFCLLLAHLYGKWVKTLKWNIAYMQNQRNSQNNFITYTILLEWNFSHNMETWWCPLSDKNTLNLVFPI